MAHEIGHTGSGSGGGDPPAEDDPRFPRFGLRAQGLLAIAFGIALGLAFLLFYFILRVRAATFIDGLHLTAWWSFVYGFIGGFVIAVIYNMLVLRRLNLFGLDYYNAH
ncbi:MAG: hypothetical protein ONB46_17915 [candidate division KSB1 bacterium]|nr:hypothetical protein [candidate division KSB1 bacterium]MDZ7367678.1 hypothetical protein [candidate division KSB1 bacterium]MDZ7404807.1 hypothetical protein [candidate division KSB1 bacterium]